MNNSFRYSLLLLMILWPSTLRAQERPVSPIDKALDIPMRYDARMEIIKHRALALSDHMDTLNESEP